MHCSSLIRQDTVLFTYFGTVYVLPQPHYIIHIHINYLWSIDMLSGIELFVTDGETFRSFIQFRFISSTKYPLFQSHIYHDVFTIARTMNDHMNYNSNVQILYIITCTVLARPQYPIQSIIIHLHICTCVCVYNCTSGIFFGKKYFVVFVTISICYQNLLNREYGV